MGRGSADFRGGHPAVMVVGPLPARLLAPGVRAVGDTALFKNLWFEVHPASQPPGHIPKLVSNGTFNSNLLEAP